jgi:hypothetical protein
MIVYTIAQVLTSQVPPPAPPAPPAIHVVQPNRNLTEVTTVDVVVRAGNEVLFEGPLRVAVIAPAAMSHEQTEAPPAGCPAKGYRDRAVRRLRLNLSANAGQGGDRDYAVSVSWTRPIDRACPAPTGTRTVELTETVMLSVGRAVTVTGDGDLSVTLRRR